jgi:hypothetical protein
MFNSVRTFGDWLLSALMPKAEAGACVPVNGHACTITMSGRFNCTGECIT